MRSATSSIGTSDADSSVAADDSHLPEDIDERGLDALSRALAQSRQQRLASVDLRNLPAVSVTTNADVQQNASVGTDWGIEL
jgi:hypothetical protein